MTKILSYLIILLLFFSCSNAAVKDDKKPKSLKAESYIPDLPSKLREISGLIVYDDLFWGFNDSGGKDELYGFDKTGEIQKEIEIKDAKNRDWESITQDKSHIYIGDFGNNGGGREGLCIYKIKKKDIKNKAEQKVDAKKIGFNYANQTKFGYMNNSTPFDCEAMVKFNNKLYIFSKNWQDFTTTFYKIPTKKGDYTIHPLDTFDVNGLITGADISTDKKYLALLGYKNYKSFIWLFSGFENDDFFKGEANYYYLEGLDGSQTEGITFADNQTLLVSTESTKRFKQQVFVLDITEIIDGAHSDK